MGLLKRLIFWSGFTAGAYKAYQSFPGLVQKGLLTAGESDRGRSVLRALPSAHKTAQRYIAGSTLPEAIAIAKEINARKKAVSLAYLADSQYGLNSVPNRNKIGEMIAQSAAENLNADITITPTTLGIRHNTKLAWQNLKLLLDKTEAGVTLWLDAEDHSTTTDMLALYQTAREQGYDNVGVTIQGALYRSWGDINKLAERGDMKVRLTLGMLNEPSEHGFPQIADGRDNLVRIALFAMQQNGVRPCLVSHDDDVIQAVMDGLRTHGLDKNAAEFVIPYGVRPDLQSHLVVEGYAVRVYLPWGNAWEGYLTQRLAAEPSEAILLLGNF